MPLPMWRRGNDLAITDCNLAYAAALDASRETVLGSAKAASSPRAAAARRRCALPRAPPPGSAANTAAS